MISRPSHLSLPETPHVKGDAPPPPSVNCETKSSRLFCFLMAESYRLANFYALIGTHAACAIIMMAIYMRNKYYDRLRINYYRIKL